MEIYGDALYKDPYPSLTHLYTSNNNIAVGDISQFKATVYDQYGLVLDPSIINYSISGGGTITNIGMFNATQTVNCILSVNYDNIYT